MKRLLLLAILLSVSTLLSACATFTPTGYVPAGPDGQGYQVKALGQGGYVAIYKGNARTDVSDAISYTMLTGYGYCEKMKQVAMVEVPKDFSESTTSTYVSSYSTPIYGRNGSVSYIPQTYSYPVTRTYPQFYSAFTCRGAYKTMKATPKFEKVSRELVHPTTKDFKGGLLVKELAPENKAFKESDVLIKVGGYRVETEADLYDTLSKAEGTKVKVEVIRSQKIVKSSVEVADITDSVQQLRDKMVKYLCAKLDHRVGFGTMGTDAASVSGPAICPSTVGPEAGKEVVTK